MSATQADPCARHVSLYSEADALYRRGEVKAARVLFCGALALAPRDGDTLHALGNCLSELGQPRRAERYFRFALTSASFSERGDLLYNLANARFDQQRYRAALSLYRRVPRGCAAFSMARRNAQHCLRAIHRRPAPSQAS